MRCSHQNRSQTRIKNNNNTTTTKDYYIILNLSFQKQIFKRVCVFEIYIQDYASKITILMFLKEIIEKKKKYRGRSFLLHEVKGKKKMLFKRIHEAPKGKVIIFGSTRETARS